ncbi:hypothetical protein HIM_07050 [Hirsutella minnesotensis 3608]|uniref:Exonuclease domain-containing protein n=1 Tax=Hirsutella minnesotensis 3608 TaxID=1043627 RepID=A0A0F8A4F6_9HYPO|nr:hypothetical protein HIM_07050 [Hirsutella minnesotensis 3608]
MSADASGPVSPGDEALVWIDCEMTGLDPDTDEILEIYCLVTNGNLDVVDPAGFHAVVHWPQARLDAMDACVHADRAFLRRPPYAPVVDHLHYRVLDVSAVKEAARRWCPGVLEAAPRKRGRHVARDDILESIAEARFYRDAIFAHADGQAKDGSRGP